MEPVELGQVKTAMEGPGALLGQQHSQLNGNDSLEAMANNTVDLATQLQQVALDQQISHSPRLSQQSAPQDAKVDHAREPFLPMSHPYGGEPGTCRSFLSSCSLIFQLQPSSFSTYIITLLTGRAREWGNSRVECRFFGLPRCPQFH